MKVPECAYPVLGPDIFRAIEFASCAHDGSYRYGKPFIRHPVGAALLLQFAGADEDVIIAGVLHDIIEHTSFERGNISERFGPYVAELVFYVTEDKVSNKSWKGRKIDAMNALGPAPLDAVMVRWADKTDSLISLLNEIKIKGEEVWEVYPRKNGQIWYYNTLNELFRKRFDGTDHEGLSRWFADLVHQLNGYTCQDPVILD